MSNSTQPTSASWSRPISSPRGIRGITNGSAKTHGPLERMGSPSLRLARLALYLAWTVGLMPVQVIGLALRRRWTSRLPVFYHRWCCRILGFRIQVIGTQTAERPVLFAANHISYTDITILGSVITGSFIAKAEVADWPFFGWLAKLQRSVFVDRQVRTTATQRDAISDRLAAGDALILFPEGTSGDGNRVLPFKSALFGAAHMWSMVGLGTVEVVVEFHPPTFLSDCGSRKALAGYCYARIAGGLAAALFGRQQPVPDPPGLSAGVPLPAAIPRAAA